MATKKTPTAKPKPVVAEAPVADPAPEKAARAPGLKIRDLVDRVASVTGGKKKGVKEMVEATLTELGAALGRGQDLNLPGLGRARVAKSADRGGASIVTLKVKLGGGGGGGGRAGKTVAEPLAEDGEDS